LGLIFREDQCVIRRTRVHRYFRYLREKTPEYSKERQFLNPDAF